MIQDNQEDPSSIPQVDEQEERQGEQDSSYAEAIRHHSDARRTTVRMA